MKKVAIKEYEEKINVYLVKTFDFLLSINTGENVGIIKNDLNDRLNKFKDSIIDENNIKDFIQNLDLNFIPNIDEIRKKIKEENPDLFQLNKDEEKNFIFKLNSDLNEMLDIYNKKKGNVRNKNLFMVNSLDELIENYNLLYKTNKYMELMYSNFKNFVNENIADKNPTIYHAEDEVILFISEYEFVLENMGSINQELTAKKLLLQYFDETKKKQNNKNKFNG